MDNLPINWCRISSFNSSFPEIHSQFAPENGGAEDEAFLPFGAETKGLFSVANCWI